MFCSSCPKQLEKWLSLAEYWYNINYHSALGHTPFEVLYGHKPKHFGIQDTEVCQVQELDKWMQERELMPALIKQHLVRVQL
jgi:hypothetical protein